MDTNYFDNISETDKSFTHIPIPDQFATSLEDNNSSDEEDLSKWETDSESLIDENIEHENEREILQTEYENEKEILQIENNNLKPCAVIDYIDGNIKKCGATNKLRKLWQLVGTWQLDTDTVEQAEGQLENLVVYSNDINLKNKTLSLITSTLQILKKDQFNFNFQNPPSLFTIQTIFKFYKINLNEKISWNHKECYDLGKKMANILLREKKQIISQKLQLEEPKSLLEFYKALPFQLIQFFEGLIQTFLEKLNNNANQKQQKRKKENYYFKNLNKKKIQKIIIFITSIIVSLGFKGTKIWLIRMLANLCQKPHLLSSLYKVLLSIGAIDHTKRWEYILEKNRIDAAEPTLRLLKGSNIWNACVIDNIDIKKKTFSYGNIYDVTRSSIHATLRLVFQFQLPIDITSISNNIIELNEESQLFGYNQISNEIINTLKNILKESLNISKNPDLFFSHETNIEIINQKIIDTYKISSKCIPTHLVILEAGRNPNNDMEIFEACEKYYKDFGINDESEIDIFCDQALFQRVLKYHNNKPQIKPLLGQ
ncbi:hypothetical protein Glove_152g51 [Diversispora epigaea]|uniref:Uncharacterized protein n=1 Tax=Diversispora epigaea TaxID=1348612 RepID=A0A397IYZ7_9GLOM|nr:hypothetical protein Glove_152g51 [Diversispora epigaea]